MRHEERSIWAPGRKQTYYRNKSYQNILLEREKNDCLCVNAMFRFSLGAVM